MIVLEEHPGGPIVVKRAVDNPDHVRIGILSVTLCKDGVLRKRKLKCPPCEYTVNDIRDLLDELEQLP